MLVLHFVGELLTVALCMRMTYDTVWAIALAAEKAILMSVTCSCYCLSYSSCHVRVLLLSVTIPVGELIGEQQCSTCLAMFGEQHLLAMFGEQHRDLFSE